MGKGKGNGPSRSVTAAELLFAKNLSLICYDFERVSNHTQPRFLTGYLVARYVCSYTPLTPLNCFSALHFITLASLTLSPLCSPAHSFRSLPCGIVEIPKYLFTLWTRLTGAIAFVVVIGNTPDKLSI